MLTLINKLTMTTITTKKTSRLVTRINKAVNTVKTKMIKIQTVHSFQFHMRLSLRSTKKSFPLSQSILQEHVSRLDLTIMMLNFGTLAEWAAAWADHSNPSNRLRTIMSVLFVYPSL